MSRDRRLERKRSRGFSAEGGPGPRRTADIKLGCADAKSVHDDAPRNADHHVHQAGAEAGTADLAVAEIRNRMPVTRTRFKTTDPWRRRICVVTA
jgi:hypothetical protein